MRIKSILKGLENYQIYNFRNYNIESITHVSNDVVKNSIFICIDGNKYNGNDYIDEALVKGAVCIVSSKKVEVPSGVCLIVVEDVRIVMSIFAKNFYNRCCDNLKIIGIVGTAGKTSTCMILSQILSLKHNNIGIIGTNGIFIGGIKQENKFTTPDPLELHYIFYQMKNLGVKLVLMEISAQAIYYNKVLGIRFETCVFTNISEEHLDFFGTLENYAKVKMSFFKAKNMKQCVVNIDDFYGRELAYKVDIPCVSFGVLEPANSFATKINIALDKTLFVANILDDIVDCDIPLVGEFSVYNVLAALTVAKLIGFSQKDLQCAIKKIKAIEGRFNIYSKGESNIIIDFAHTPESIDKLLDHISGYSDKKIISLFGCVGYSDKEKRHKMASVVDKYSTHVIFTSDNPGDTKFEELCKDVKKAFIRSNYVFIEDRKKAIKYGVDLLDKDSILVLIGKGAESFQKIKGERLPYSEKDVLLEILESCD